MDYFIVKSFYNDCAICILNIDMMVRPLNIGLKVRITYAID